MDACLQREEGVCVRACVFFWCVCTLYLMAVSGRDTVVGCTQVRGSHNEVHVVVGVIILRREKWKEGGGEEGKGEEEGRGKGGEGRGGRHLRDR